MMTPITRRSSSTFSSCSSSTTTSSQVAQSATNNQKTSNSSSPTSTQKKFRCSYSRCNKSFSRSEHLHRHSLNHKDGTHTCPRCSTHFRRRDLLDRHMTRHREKDDEAGGPGLGYLATRKRLWRDADGTIVSARRPNSATQQNLQTQSQNSDPRPFPQLQSQQTMSQQTQLDRMSLVNSPVRSLSQNSLSSRQSLDERVNENYPQSVPQSTRRGDPQAFQPGQYRFKQEDHNTPPMSPPTPVSIQTPIAVQPNVGYSNTYSAAYAESYWSNTGIIYPNQISREESVDSQPYVSNPPLYSTQSLSQEWERLPESRVRGGDCSNGSGDDISQRLAPATYMGPSFWPFDTNLALQQQQQQHSHEITGRDGNLHRGTHMDNAY